jgi:hypothetical protein
MSKKCQGQGQCQCYVFRGGYIEDSTGERWWHENVLTVAERDRAAMEAENRRLIQVIQGLREFPPNKPNGHVTPVDDTVHLAVSIIGPIPASVDPTHVEKRQGFYVFKIDSPVYVKVSTARKTWKLIDGPVVFKLGKVAYSGVVNNPRFSDMLDAALAYRRETGDDHHVFLEGGYEPEKKKGAKSSITYIHLIMGS